MPRILLGGRKDRAEDTTGGNVRIAERQREQAAQAAAIARERIEVLQPLSVDLPLTGLPFGKRILEVDDATVGYQPDQPVLCDFSLTITGPERVAVTGANGAGKTTLLLLVTGKLKPSSGAAETFTNFAYLDQQVSVLDATISVRDNFLRMNPLSNEQQCREKLAKFMFRADAALQTVSTLSAVYGANFFRDFASGFTDMFGGRSPSYENILIRGRNAAIHEMQIRAERLGCNAIVGLVVQYDAIGDSCS